MALLANTRSHFTTIADFIANLDKKALHLFRDILLYCDQMGLIGKEMFAIDGCKLPSNASKELRVARADFEKKAAKMKTSKGVIQGYDGVATVGSKHQIVVYAEAWGEAQEHDLLKPMEEGTAENFEAIGDKDIFSKTRLTTDNGFHNEKNMEMPAEKGIDGYVADNQFRKHDPLLRDRDRYKELHRKERARFEGGSGLFKVDEITFAGDLSHAICSTGKKLYRSGTNIDDGKFLSHRFKGPKSASLPCKLRTLCLRKPEKTEIRQVAFFHGRSGKGKNTFTEKMKRKIDSAVGRFFYSKRLGTIEPVFAKICSTIGLDRFKMRGKTKNNSQWLMFCMLHNLKKIHQFGPGLCLKPLKRKKIARN